MCPGFCEKNCTSFKTEFPHQVQNGLNKEAHARKRCCAKQGEFLSASGRIRVSLVVVDADARLVVYGRVPVSMDARAASGNKHARVQLPQLQASAA